MDWTCAGWEAGLLGYEQYRTVSVHDTADSGTIVVEQEVIGTSNHRRLHPPEHRGAHGEWWADHVFP